MRTFRAWLDALDQTGSTASERFAGQLASTDAAVRAIAMARMVQLGYRVASLIARAPIPEALRTGDFAADTTAAYCAQFAEMALQLVEHADDYARACAEKLVGGPAGWWNAVCTAA